MGEGRTICERAIRRFFLVFINWKWYSVERDVTSEEKHLTVRNSVEIETVFMLK